MMNVLSKVFPIRSCTYFIDKSVIEAKKISLCLDYHINKCEGPCEGLVSESHYSQMVKRIEKFIRGRSRETVKYIEKLMLKASDEQKFEIAAMYRDQLNDIKLFHDKQTVTGSNFDDRDVIALANNNAIGIAVILRIRNGRIISREKLSLTNLDVSPQKNMATIITRFYLDSDFIPKQLLLQDKPTNEKELTSIIYAVSTAVQDQTLKNVVEEAETGKVEMLDNQYLIRQIFITSHDFQLMKILTI